MLRNISIGLTIFASLLCTFAMAQNQPQEKKNPIEIAAEQADRLQIDLKLDHRQLFLTDSVLQKNIAGVMNEFEAMQKAGMQNSESYRDVQLKWVRKTEDAFEKFMSKEQFERYLKISGVSSKERKKRAEKK